MRGSAFKRSFDFVFAIVALGVLGPLLAGIALLVRVNLGGPVLFRQTRPGLDGEPFEILKFRTMADTVGPDGELMPDSQRLSKFGKGLRSTSLDELPELINIVRGDMSLVGPRPLLLEYLPLYSDEQFRRHDVRPGLTGWAQIHGRNALSWEEKFALDVWYVDNRSNLLDLQIIFRTAGRVLDRQGIRADGHDTAPPFRGTEAPINLREGPQSISLADEVPTPHNHAH